MPEYFDSVVAAVSAVGTWLSFIATAFITWTIYKRTEKNERIQQKQIEEYQELKIEQEKLRIEQNNRLRELEQKLKIQQIEVQEQQVKVAYEEMRTSRFEIRLKIYFKLYELYVAVQDAFIWPNYCDKSKENWLRSIIVNEMNIESREAFCSIYDSLLLGIELCFNNDIYEHSRNFINVIKTCAFSCNTTQYDYWNHRINDIFVEFSSALVLERMKDQVSISNDDIQNEKFIPNYYTYVMRERINELILHQDISLVFLNQSNTGRLTYKISCCVCGFYTAAKLVFAPTLNEKGAFVDWGSIDVVGTPEEKWVKEVLMECGYPKLLMSAIESIALRLALKEIRGQIIFKGTEEFYIRCGYTVNNLSFYKKLN